MRSMRICVTVMIGKCISSLKGEWHLFIVRYDRKIITYPCWLFKIYFEKNMKKMVRFLYHSYYVQCNYIMVCSIEFKSFVNMKTDDLMWRNKFNNRLRKRENVSIISVR